MMRFAVEVGEMFRLSPEFAECDKDGVRIGGRPMLECRSPNSSRPSWSVRESKEINAALTELFGVPVDAQEKIAGLRVAADALNSGDVAKAQIAVLLMRLPSPPVREATYDQRARFHKRMRECGWLSKDWDPQKHPRSGVAPNPGRFAPVEGGDSSHSPAAGLPSNSAQDKHQELTFSGSLIDKRYDEVAGITHCTYSTPLGTFSIEYNKGYLHCPETWPAPLF